VKQNDLFHWQGLLSIVFVSLLIFVYFPATIMGPVYFLLLFVKIKQKIKQTSTTSSQHLRQQQQ
jgi:hypothetical protein